MQSGWSCHPLCCGNHRCNPGLLIPISKHCNDAGPSQCVLMGLKQEAGSDRMDSRLSVLHGNGNDFYIDCLGDGFLGPGLYHFQERHMNFLLMISTPCKACLGKNYFFWKIKRKARHKVFALEDNGERFHMMGNLFKIKIIKFIFVCVCCVSATAHIWRYVYICIYVHIPHIWSEENLPIDNIKFYIHTLVNKILYYLLVI